MSKISKTTLGNLVEFQRGYDLPKSQFQDGTVPVISSNGILGYHNQSKVKGPGITIGRSGTVGLPHYINENFFPHNTALFIKDFKGNYPRYIYYLIKTLGLNDYKSGSGVPTMNRNHLHPIKVRAFLDIEDQKKIAKVLSDLDAKIELNNKINTELESMAKTLFDYWFEQFDFPNASGKPYNTSGGKMVWNEKVNRKIPEGWEVEKVSECTNIIDCLHSKKSDYNFEDEKFYLLQLENIKNDGLIDLSKKYYVKKEDYKIWTSRIELKDHDIVITNAGRVAATAQIPNNVITGIGRNITAIRPTTISPTFLYVAFQCSEMKRQIAINTDTGTFFKSLNVKGIKELLIIRPLKNIEQSFENLVLPYRRKREQNQVENQELISLRDWLLPMLMNGQVTVGDFEERLDMVAEKTGKKVVDKVKKTKTTTIKLNPADVYKRTLLATEIVFQLKDTYTLGHLKLQKMLYLCQEIENMSLPMNFLKQAMGPYDNQLARSLDKQFVEKKWFEYQKEASLKFKPLENCGKHRDDFNKYFEDQLEGINYLIKKFTKFTSNQIEAVATLYACWKEAIENKELINDKLIITKFYNWSKEKEKFKEENLIKALTWMRKNGIEPKN